MSYSLYVYGRTPLKQAELPLTIGEKYVDSKGTVYLFVKDETNVVALEKLFNTPLNEAIKDNTMENLTDVQLQLFWQIGDYYNKKKNEV